MESEVVEDQRVHLVVALLLSTPPVVITAECVGELLAINTEVRKHLDLGHLVNQSIPTTSMELV